MSGPVTRRSFLAGAGSLGGLLLAGCDAQLYTPPRVRGGVMGAADVLTMATQRLLMSGQPLAREFDRADISAGFPTWGETNPGNDEFQRLLRGGFADWRLPVSGLVGVPSTFTLEDLKRLPRRTQVTMHICEQGWSAIAEWTGTPLLEVLRAAGGVTEGAKYVMVDTFDDWYECYDMFDVVSPQTILAYGMNGKDLPLGNGAPLRLRVERQCGYKNLKFIKSIAVAADVAGFGLGTGGVNSDYDWHWYAGA